MKSLIQLLLALATLLLLPALTDAQDESETQLPRVLILGDSIYTQHARGVGAALEGRLEVSIVSVPRPVVCNSTTMLEQIDALLGEEKWDVIHFNAGLGDLVHKVPDIESFRVMPIYSGGVVATAPGQYEANLRQLVSRLKETEAVLIWASTTPIRASTSQVFRMESETEYNAIAARVMAEEGIQINDMYTYARDRMDMGRPAGHGADPFHYRDLPLEPPMVFSVLTALGLPADPVPPPETGEDQG
ncbi:MAG: SGNH/GDSL hydrolase family protein [Planctomycetota bacterium]